MTRLKNYDIISDKSIANWDEGLPLGNGQLGCLIYGNGPLRLAIDRVDLWDSRSHPNTLEEAFTFQNLVRLSKSDKQEDWEERRRLFETIAEEFPYPSKLTAGRIELDFGIKTDDISARIDIAKAIAKVDVNNGFAKIEAFMSATSFIGVAKVFGEYDINLHIPKYISSKGNDLGEVNKNSCLHYPKASIIRDGEYIYYKQTTHTDFSYGVVLLRKNFSEYSELYFTVVTSNDADDFIELAKKKLSRLANSGYEGLKKTHIAWWKRYWHKSQISIGDCLLEKIYYRSWYLFASCSRKGCYPMPLQGVWTADNDSLPPWRGDYHHDTNTQLSYQAFLKANRLSEGETFIDYLWSMKGVFEDFARSFYGVKGILLPSCSTLDGKPIGGWSHYALSPTMTIWAAQSFDEYYLYTGDEEFLRTRAYPFFKGVGDAIYALLEERDGKLYLPISSSPEIFDDTKRAYLQPNSNYDLALMIYLYRTLRGYAQVLGEDGTQYEKLLSKLDDIAIDADGVVLLDKTQRLPESHRHFSHLMCMYPLHLINYDTEEHKHIYESTLTHLEQLGTGWWVGFSFAMSAQLYAMAKNGNAAYEKLRAFCKGFIADNGFHLNGDFKNYGFSQWHYRPFTLESSFGFCDALQEMLLQDHQGYIELFPAVPDEWKKSISFSRLRSRQGVLISAKLRKGYITEIVLESQSPIKVHIRNNFFGDILSVRINGVKHILKVGKGELIKIYENL